MRAQQPVSLVTGASSGIGAAFAEALAARGHDVVLSARRADRLHALADRLRRQYRCTATVLPADLGEPAAPQQMCGWLADQGITVDWLINNAGYGVPGRFDANDWAVHARFLRVLVDAPLELAWRLLPGMRARGYGRIINVASLAGLVPGTAGHTLYAPAKSLLIKFSQGLALENHAHGVHVCALCPGFTRSEFHDVTGTRTLMNRLPGFLWQTAEAVAHEGIDAAERGTPVHVTGRINRVIKAINELLPDAIAFHLAARQSRRYRAADDHAQGTP